jgi:NAD(P)-dependent dehydrogenase (short-subunit alcohol dehydrogenase family)
MAERLNLTGRVAMITGAASGIGAETARRLVARGAQVALMDIDAANLDRMQDELRDSAVTFAGDVTDRAALDAAVAATRKRFGRIDVLVANAGVAPPSEPVAGIEEGAFERTVEIDALGVWRTVRAALPEVIMSKGHVVLISSIYAFFNGFLNASYAMSKAAVEQLGRALRVELAPQGATAGVAYFAFVDTPMVRTAFSRPHVARARGALPRWFSRPIELGVAADALVRGIERRSPVVTAPGWVGVALLLRGPLAALDGRLARDPRILDALRDAPSADRMPEAITPPAGAERRRIRR